MAAGERRRLIELYESGNLAWDIPQKMHIAGAGASSTPTRHNRGWLDDLLVIITSDHGEMAGDHGRVYTERTFQAAAPDSHESALRVPLIVALAGNTVGVGSRTGIADAISRRAGRKHRCRCCRRCWRRSACREVAMPPTNVPRRMNMRCSISAAAGDLEPGGAAPHRRSVERDLLRRLKTRNTMLKTARHKYVIDQDGRGSRTRWCYTPEQETCCTTSPRTVERKCSDEQHVLILVFQVGSYVDLCGETSERWGSRQPACGSHTADTGFKVRYAYPHLRALTCAPARPL